MTTVVARGIWTGKTETDQSKKQEEYIARTEAIRNIPGIFFGPLPH
jgi:hypothetical protein